MINRFRKLLDQPWFFILVLLFIGVLAYGLLIPSLGFYWDDYEGVYLYHLDDPSISFDYYSERPLASIPFLLLFPFVKMTPITWQVTSFLLRWGGTLFIYLTLNIVWPSRSSLHRWMAVLLFVFPGFLQQPVSVAFSHHHTAFLFFAASFYLTALALRDRRLFWLYMPLSFLLGGLQMFMMEYFVLLESTRLLIIWFMLIPEERRAFRKALLTWLPFALLLITYLVWRLFLRQDTGNEAQLLEKIATEPEVGFIGLFITVYKDLVHMFSTIWFKAFLDPTNTDLTARRVWAAWALGALGAVIFALWNRPGQRRPAVTSSPAWQPLLFGVVALVLGAIPVWVSGRAIAGGMWSERFTLGPMLGVVILLVSLVDWLFRLQVQKQILLALMLGVSISGQFVYQVQYRNDWKAQRNLYWQLHWRIPALLPGTALFGKGTPTFRSSYYDTIYIMNLIYAEEVKQEAEYAYFDIHHVGFDDYKPGMQLNQVFRGITFSGSTSQALVFDFGIPGACLKVLDPIYEWDPELNPSVTELFDISDVSYISRTAESKPMPELFGAEPAHDWCYYFEKADLARQFQDWDAVLELKAGSDSLGLTPDMAAEYFPFIEALAHTDQWDQAFQLSQTAWSIGKGGGMALCNLWLAYPGLDPAPPSEMQEQALETFCQPESP